MKRLSNPLFRPPERRERLFSVRMKSGAAMVLFLGLFAACRKKKDAVLAQVGSESVTAAEFKREIGNRPYASDEYLDTLPGRKELLELMVRRKIVLSEAKRAGFARRPDIKKKLEEIESEFDRQRQEARDRVVIGEFFRYLQERDLKVTDQEVRGFWEKEKEIKAAHILLSDLQTATRLRERLTKGESFEELAKKYSQDPATGRQGGNLGYILPGTLVPEFEKALFSLKTGEISDVVASPYGYHLIRKLEERKLSQTPFENMGERIRSVLEKKKFQAWIDETRKRYAVSTDAPALQAVQLQGTTPGAPKKTPAAP